MSRATLRYGIVGVKTFGIGWEHLQAVERMDGAEVVAICSTNEEELARVAEALPHDVALYADSSAMLLGEELDAVIVATPNFTHEEIAIQAFDAGAHVLCEKPLAPSLRACDAIVAAAERCGRLLQVGLHRRYNRLFRRLASLLQAGELGKPVMMWSQEFRDDWGRDYKIDTPDRAKPKGGGAWRHDQSASGGTLLEKSSHDFDVFNWFAGADPVTVTATGGLAAYEGRSTIDHAIVMVEYANGVKATLQLGMFVPFGFKGRYEGLVGDRGSVRIDEGSHTMVQYFRGHPSEIRYREAEPQPGHGHAIQVQNEEFAACIRAGRRPFADGAVGRACAAVALAAEESIRRGAPVRVPPPGEALEASGG